MILAPRNKKLCPHINDPCLDCYCSRLTSSDIEKAIYYCSGNFESCEIYKLSFSHAAEGVPNQ